MYGLGQLGNEFLASTQCTQFDPNPSFNYQEVIANLNAELAQKDTKIQTIESELATTKSILHHVVSHLGLSPMTPATVQPLQHGDDDVGPSPDDHDGMHQPSTAP
ncbi:hypothetical protein E2542_SST14199 [Spatholobus suberectus]|nr:hypothetical protein E2542_SST14199 [Spatholobus suberectus]